MWEVKNSGLTLVEAEEKLKEWELHGKYSYSHMDCCRYFIQPEL